MGIKEKKKWKNKQKQNQSRRRRIVSIEMKGGSKKRMAIYKCEGCGREISEEKFEKVKSIFGAEPPCKKCGGTFKKINKKRKTDSRNFNIDKKETMRYVTYFIVGVILLVLFFRSVYAIPAGHVGVLHLFGKVDDMEKAEGIHLKNPLKSVIKMSVKTQEYTMSGIPNEGQKRGINDAISALTREGLTVDLDVTVWYRLESSRASDVYRTIGINYVDVLVRPKIRESIRAITAEYDVKTIYSEQRNALQVKIEKVIQEDLKDRGIIVERVLLRNVRLPAKLSDSIEQKLQAEQDAQRMFFVLQKEEQEAERKKIEAGGIADANKIISQSLTNEYLEWYWIQNLDKHQDTIYVPIGENGIPLFRSV